MEIGGLSTKPGMPNRNRVGCQVDFLLARHCRQLLVKGPWPKPVVVQQERTGVLPLLMVVTSPYGSEVSYIDAPRVKANNGISAHCKAEGVGRSHKSKGIWHDLINCPEFRHNWRKWT